MGADRPPYRIETRPVGSAGDPKPLAQPPVAAAFIIREQRKKDKTKQNFEVFRARGEKSRNYPLTKSAAGDKISKQSGPGWYTAKREKRKLKKLLDKAPRLW